MISNFTKAVIDAVNKLVSFGREEDYVVVLNREAYKRLTDDQNGICFVYKRDENDFPERFCGMDVIVDNRISPDSGGMIILREEWNRIKEQLDEIEKNPLFFLDKQ